VRLTCSWHLGVREFEAVDGVDPVGNFHIFGRWDGGLSDEVVELTGRAPLAFEAFGGAVLAQLELGAGVCWVCKLDVAVRDWSACLCPFE